MVSRELHSELWQLFFNGASRMGHNRKIVVGAWATLIPPRQFVLPYACFLTMLCFNKIAKYNALIFDLYVAEKMVDKYLKAYGDSKLVIHKVKRGYKVRHKGLEPY